MVGQFGMMLTQARNFPQRGLSNGHNEGNALAIGRAPDQAVFSGWGKIITCEAAGYFEVTKVSY
jgi:hypothetical protein